METRVNLSQFLDDSLTDYQVNKIIEEFLKIGLPYYTPKEEVEHALRGNNKE